MTRIRTRDAAEADVERLVEIEVAARDDAGRDPEACRWSITRALRSSERLLVVADGPTSETSAGSGAAAGPVGWGKAAFLPQAPDGAPAGWYLTGLAVDPTYQRRGVGRAITSERLRRLDQRAPTVWCFTNAANDASIALHLALGFVEIARGSSYQNVRFDSPDGPGTGVGVLLCRTRPSA